MASAATDPEWMAAALRAAGRFRATTRRTPGAGHNVYVVLLRRAGRGSGLYVGQTARDPDLRFDQHKGGYRSSRFVRRFGVRLLPEATLHLNPMRRWEAEDLEAALAEGFRRAGVPWVEGGH